MLSVPGRAGSAAGQRGSSCDNDLEQGSFPTCRLPVHTPNCNHFKIKRNLEATLAFEKNFLEHETRHIPYCLWGVLTQFRGSWTQLFSSVCRPSTILESAGHSAKCTACPCFLDRFEQDSLGWQ